MKCQKCDKTASCHITELTGGKPQEFHLCEDHAREYLSQAEDAEGLLAGAEKAAQQFAVAQTAEELAKLDRKTCPVCGIAFHEFRKNGRLGCPHDYLCFERELAPLLVNIHGDVEHRGKRPKRQTGGTDHLTNLVRLRRELKAAIDAENYEQASKLRDEIRALEGSASS